MSFLSRFWKFITPTKALEISSGYYETLFFESLYRVIYIVGFSFYDKNILYLLYSYTMKSLMLAFVAFMVWFLCSQKNVDLIIENMNVTLINAIALYRYVVMVKNKNIFDKLSQAMESKMFDVSTQKRAKMVEFWAKKNETYLKMLLGLGSCTLAAWYVYPLVDDVEYNLTVTTKLPFDYRDPVIYPITYTVLAVVFNYVAFFVMLNDLIMQVTLIHLLCQYAVLADCFENILQDCNIKEDNNYELDEWKNKYLDRLSGLVHHHKFLIENSTKLKDILSTPMLLQFGASGMLICFIAYQVTVVISVSIVKFLMCLQFLGYNMFILFTFCRWCEEIRVQSENIRDAVYNSGWERGAANVREIRSRLMLVMLRAGKPVVMSAGGIYALTLESYSAVIKTSYTALSVLLRLRQD